jgi:hypothetical protein
MFVMFGIVLGLDYPFKLLLFPTMIIVFIIDRELDGRYGVLLPSESQQNKEGEQGEQGGLGNPLPAPSRSRRVATNLNLSRRLPPGSGWQVFDVSSKELKTMPSGSIVNALIRCTRQDRVAEGLFELTRPDLGLWVLELDFELDATQANQIDGICRQLRSYSDRLKILQEGSADYTLHLTFELPEHERIILPPKLSRLASECGFNIELHADRNEES